MFKFNNFISLIVFASASFANAAEIFETRVYEGVPGASEVARWSASGVARHYRFEIDMDLPSATDRILTIKNARSLTIITNVYPTDRSTPLWQKLAAAGVNFEGQGDLIFPTQLQAARLNVIGFKTLSLRFDKFPEEEKGEMLGLRALTVPFVLVYNAKRYPLSVDVANLKSTPTLSLASFVTGYWPRQTHVDLLNQLPSGYAIEVENFLPTANDLPYLKGLTGLKNLKITQDEPPSKLAFWSSFTAALPSAELPVTWRALGALPNTQHIEAFLNGGGPRLLSLGDYEQLDQDRLAAIEGAQGSVERVSTID